MENIMTIDQAKAYIAEVMAIVESELPSYYEIQTWQNRRHGYIWAEGFKVDYDEDEGNGTFQDTVGMHYYVRCHEDDTACIRKDKHTDGHIHTDMPFYGTPREAADYVLEQYRKYERESA